MSQFRADFDVKGSLVLPTGSEPFRLRSQSTPFEMTFRNAELDESGHATNLVVEVVGNSESIDDVASQFRTLLARQLDMLSFVTQSRFTIERCTRVIEW